LSKKIDARSTGKDEFFTAKNELRKKMDDCQAVVDKCVKDKETISKQLGDQAAAEKEKRQELNSAKRKLAYQTEDEIDQAISEMEFRMMTGTMPLKEEKETLKQISELKKSKQKIREVKGLEAKVEGGGDLASKALPLKEQREVLNEKIREAKEEKKNYSAQYGKLMEMRNKQMQDMPDLFEKRGELSKEIGEKVKERNSLRDAFREKERAYNAYLAEQRAIRAERARAEREKRNAEWEERKKARELEKAEEQPFLTETTLIEQTIAWCKAQMPKEETAKTEEKKVTEYNNPEGAKILQKKNDREEEFYFAPTKRKGPKAGGGKKKATSNAIKHNVETFKLFDTLKLDAPITTDEIPALLEKLDSQLAGYMVKVEAWKKEREDIASGKKKPEPAAEEKAEEEEKTEE